MSVSFSIAVTEKNRFLRAHIIQFGHLAKNLNDNYTFATKCNNYYNLTMRSIADAVREIVATSEPVTTALRGGYLNMSAYAQMIRQEVEKYTSKEVKVGSIVIALMRLRSVLKLQSPLLPDVLIDDLSLKTGLMEIVFERTDNNLKTLSRLPTAKKIFQDCFMVSHGVGEISIIALQSAENELKKAFSDSPRAVVRNLASLTIRYSSRYIETPNSLYVILQHFAARRMNIVEIISTYTEVTIVVADRDIDVAFHILSGMQKSQHNNEKS